MTVLRLEDVLARSGASRAELESWIAMCWVRPLRGEEGWLFSETDIARIEMICDLSHDLGIDEEAMEVILPLIDQVYALRRSLRALADAVMALPEEARRTVLDHLAPPGESDGS